jgi:hypothetical protein
MDRSENSRESDITRLIWRFSPLLRRRADVQQSTASSFQAAEPAKLAAMRAAGHDPTTTCEVQRRRDDGPLDGLDFRRDILLKLRRLPVRVIAEAMGATISHGSKMRSGLVVPHKRHWKALREI